MRTCSAATCRWSRATATRRSATRCCPSCWDCSTSTASRTACSPRRVSSAPTIRSCLSALAAAPARLRGTVIVDETIDRATLEAMDRRGRGRHPLQHAAPRPTCRTCVAAAWRRVLEAVGRAGLARRDLRRRSAAAHAAGAGARGRRQGGRRPLRQSRPAAAPRLSGLSRAACCGGRRPYLGQAVGALPPRWRRPPTLRQRVARRRRRGQLVWASDWPWTQHGEGLTYARTLALARANGCPDAAMRERILATTPWALFRIRHVHAPHPAADPGRSIH